MVLNMEKIDHKMKNQPDFKKLPEAWGERTPQWTPLIEMNTLTQRSTFL
jgi:hypothetical protein